jgi:hypothetical protein
MAGMYGDVGQAGPAEGGDQDQIADDVRHGAEDRRLEAVRGDGIADGLDVGVLRLRRRLEGELGRADDGGSIAPLRGRRGLRRCGSHGWESSRLFLVGEIDNCSPWYSGPVLSDVRKKDEEQTGKRGREREKKK